MRVRACILAIGALLLGGRDPSPVKVTVVEASVTPAHAHSDLLNVLFICDSQEVGYHWWTVMYQVERGRQWHGVYAQAVFVSDAPIHQPVRLHWQTGTTASWLGDAKLPWGRHYRVCVTWQNTSGACAKTTVELR